MGKKKKRGKNRYFFVFVLTQKKISTSEQRAKHLLVKIHNIVAYVATVISGLRLTKVTAHYQILIVTL